MGLSSFGFFCWAHVLAAFSMLSSIVYLAVKASFVRRVDAPVAIIPFDPGTTFQFLAGLSFGVVVAIVDQISVGGIPYAKH